MSSSPERKRVRTDQRFCPHCSKLLCYKTFRAHKRLYHDETNDEWYQVADSAEVEHDAEDEAPPSTHELEDQSVEMSPSPCFDDTLGSQSLGEVREDDSPPHSEAGFSDQSEGWI